MHDPFAQGVKTLSESLNATQKATKSLTKSIEGIQQDGLDIAQRKAQERRRELKEAELRKQTALIKALEDWKHKKQISEKEAQLKIDFVKKYGAKEWEAVLKIKLDIENLERKEHEAFQHDSKAIQRVKMWCWIAALIVTLWLKFVLGVI
jgi:chromosome segregation ATPase